MSAQGRIEALEAELAAANARIAELEAAAVTGSGPRPRPRMAGAAAQAAQLGHGPLSGIKVLDFSQYQNGPTATLMLSDFGADVMKVERPGGEAGRNLGNVDDTGFYFSTYFQGLNRGKKSCPLDMNKEGAREVVKRMVQWCDVRRHPGLGCRSHEGVSPRCRPQVIVENFKPGAFAKMGYPYEQLKEWNPDVVYASNGGFGPR